MSDADTPTLAGDEVSKESYEELKRQLAQKSQDLADARARSDVEFKLCARHLRQCEEWKQARAARFLGGGEATPSGSLASWALAS